MGSDSVPSRRSRGVVESTALVFKSSEKQKLKGNVKWYEFGAKEKELIY
jgi:hypothetical protein